MSERTGPVEHAFPSRDVMETAGVALHLPVTTRHQDVLVGAMSEAWLASSARGDT